jgi:rhodanese-related sulfurtransferase
MNAFFAARRLGATMLLAAALLTACGSATDTISELVPPTEAAEVVAEQSDVVVLDVRTPEEFADARIAGAINVDYYAADFRDQLDELDKEATYVLYCRSGNRSEDANRIMRDLGFAEVYEVDGGIVAWNGAGLPVER